MNVTVKLKIRKLRSNAMLPEYAHIGDAGMDVFSCENVEIAPHQTRLISTGLSIQLPDYTEAQIRPRSGLALKQGITVLNSPGTVDEGYRGEIGVILINHSDAVVKIEVGMKIAQMVIKPIMRVEIEEVSELSSTVRGENGFGSTGK